MGHVGVTLFFLEKNLTGFFSVIASASDDLLALFSCRLLITSIFARPLSSVLSKFSH